MILIIDYYEGKHRLFLIVDLNLRRKMDRICKITPLDESAILASEERWNSIAKPLGSLGLLEEQISKIAGIIGSPDVDLSKRTAVIMCADNGVVCENVTQSPSGVTAVVAKAIADGTSNINIMAYCFNVRTMAVDVGMNTDAFGMLRKKTAFGTRNIAVGAAMTEEQAKTAITAGMDIVRDLSEHGVKIIVSGEMGIGNTTSAAAVACVLLGKAPEEITGRGAGLSSEGLKRKISVIKRAIEVNNPKKDNPIDVLSKLGGFDIAGMAGLFLGGAVYRVPVVIDGVISAVSASVAAEICPFCKDFMLASHISEEPASKLLLEKLGLKAPISAGLRLGEGTGAILLLPMLDAALAVYNSSHSFEKLSIERYTKFIR